MNTAAAAAAAAAASGYLRWTIPLISQKIDWNHAQHTHAVLI